MAAAREDVMRKVQALLDKAASTTFDAERDAFLAKADAMMMRHSIEEVELASRERGKNHGPIKPELRTIIVPMTDKSGVSDSLYTLFYRLARHVGCRIGPTHFSSADGGWAIKVVGYPTDLDYLQMLYLNLQLHFLSKMEPKPDASLTDVENFTNLWESGLSYERIFRVMGWEWATNPDGTTKQVTRKRLRPMRAAYQAKCVAEGREPIKGLKGNSYAKSFIDGYVYRINRRLDEMAEARKEASKGHEVVLAGRGSDLDEAFWDLFPDRRPHPKDCECDTCHFGKCNDVKCTRPRCVQYREDMKKPVRYRSAATVKTDHRAFGRGQQVANGADLSGNDGKVAGGGGSLR